MVKRPSGLASTDQENGKSTPVLPLGSRVHQIGQPGRGLRLGYRAGRLGVRRVLTHYQVFLLLSDLGTGQAEQPDRDTRELVLLAYPRQLAAYRAAEEMITAMLKNPVCYRLVGALDAQGAVIGLDEHNRCSRSGHTDHLGDRQARIIQMLE